MIYSRAQWGANENIRDKGSLHYYEVHAGFVHHTVNANDYTPDEVPGILRSIYAYHTQSRGWSDIGYNFLVDKFGRIWEGRYGGVDRPVVGAHTLNYNDYSFAMSAIGNYETAKPSAATLQAYGVLFAWKLSLHGVDAASPQQVVGKKTFQAINGHRDAAATACPGKNLYAQIPLIRQYAAAAQQGWTGRELESSVVGSPYPDLLVRRKSDSQVYVVPTNGMTRFGPPTSLGAGWSAFDQVLLVPDVTGDGKADLLSRVAADGSTQVRPGDGNGGFALPTSSFNSLAGHDLVTVAGDLDGDGHADLVARDAATGRLDAYLGNGQAGFTVKQLGDSLGQVRPDRRARRRQRRRSRGPRGSRHRGRLLPGARHRRRRLRRAGADPRQLEGLRHHHRSRRLQRRRQGRPARAPGRVEPGLRQAQPWQRRVRPPAGADQRSRRRHRPERRRLGVRRLGSGPAGPHRGHRRAAPQRRHLRDRHARSRPGVVLPRAGDILSAGDWDRDGAADMIVRNKSSDRLLLYRGDGAGHFAAPSALSRGFKSVKLLAAVGDMTGDGWPDLTGQPAGGSMRIYPGNGVAGLKASYAAFKQIKAGVQVPVGRWDADGAPDSLFRSGKRVRLYPGNGPGGFMGARALKLNVQRYDWMVGVGDMGVNGHAGVVVREKKTGYLWLLPGTTQGFSSRIFLAQGFKGYDLAG